MKTLTTVAPNSGRRLASILITFVVAVASIMITDLSARAAELRPIEYRVSAGEAKFANTWQFAAAYKLQPPQLLRAQHLELAVGVISTSEDNGFFVSLGPVWRLPINNRSIFVDVGISPTLLSKSTFNSHDMGGNFHFTSFVAVGAFFGRSDAMSVSLRMQHTSNGGISSTNPGMDMFGINFAYDFSAR